MCDPEQPTSDRPPGSGEPATTSGSPEARTTTGYSADADLAARREELEQRYLELTDGLSTDELQVLADTAYTALMERRAQEAPPQPLATNWQTGTHSFWTHPSELSHPPFAVATSPWELGPQLPQEQTALGEWGEALSRALLHKMRDLIKKRDALAAVRERSSYNNEPLPAEHQAELAATALQQLSDAILPRLMASASSLADHLHRLGITPHPMESLPVSRLQPLCELSLQPPAALGQTSDMASAGEDQPLETATLHLKQLSDRSVQYAASSSLTDDPWKITRIVIYTANQPQPE